MERNIDFDTRFKGVECFAFGERSESVVALSKALSLFQSQMQSISFDKVNPHFKNKYATMTAIVEACRKPLSDNGLSVSQLTFGNGGIKTVLMHSTGEYISCILTLPPTKQDAQGYGSAITYARRYSYSAILGLVSDEDDDGNQASAKTANGTANGATTTAKPKGNVLADRLKALRDQAFKDDDEMAAIDKFTAWRIDNNFPEDMKDAKELDYSKMILKLQEKLNAKN